MRLPNAIIAGAAKSGTTSLFEYLNAHPQACGSLVKETNFFLYKYTDQLQRDIISYSKYFDHCNESIRVCFEISPSYMVGGRTVAMRIEKLLDRPKVLFILRNPVDRIYSYYNYNISRFSLPRKLTFENYINLCIHEENNESSTNSNINRSHLRVLKNSCYADKLEEYLEIIPFDRLWVGFYEDFRCDPKQFMTNICHFLDVDPIFLKTMNL